MNRVEMFRRAAHVGFGLGVILLTYFIGAEYMKLLLVLLFLFLVVVMDLKIKNYDLWIIDDLLALIERPNSIPAYGAFWYTVGLLLIFSTLSSFNEIAASTVMIAIGDGVAVLVGKWGRISLPYNRAKTLEGLLAFMVGGSAAYFFIGLNGIIIAIVCGIVESINLPIDDNFTVPLASVILVRML
ncbi:hypothetical protein HY570_01610 [Candidatus Micrarchaeota archaeon]|nr:hypothetical protein [Candidatus Micrarchaeota archaeon]